MADTAVANVAETPTVDDRKEQPKSPKAFKARIDACKKIRKELVEGAWTDSVDFRRGKPFTQDSDEDRINVNLDWSLTKSKHAQLYSQTPQAYLTAKAKQFETAIPAFAKRLNDVLTQADVGSAMNESTLDAINATGIGATIVSYRSTSVKKQIHVDTQTGAPINIDGADPTVVQGAIAEGLVALTEVDDIIDRQFSCDRFSPSDLLWDVDFMGSNFDHSDWIGRSGRMLWPSAQREFKLLDEDKEKICGEAATKENLRGDTTDEEESELVVEYDEVFYWAHRFDPEEKYFKKIHRMVFVSGKKEPVVNEPWKGQVFNDQTRTYAGVCEFPISVLTLTYISDDAIPPSDSAIGRPQVLEMIKSRTQVVMQRDRSQPMRWGNVDRMDPMVMDTIQRGVYQNIIPVQGDGDKVLGEVSRADYHNEDYEFDRIINNDLERQWGASGNQNGAQTPRGQSATEAGIIEQNFQTRNGQERAKVAAHFTKNARVMAGLLALYDDFQIPGLEAIQAQDPAWDRKSLANEYVFYIRPDSTVLLDSTQRIDRLEKYLNLFGKSGYVNPKPIIAEITALNGIDPIDVLIDPAPPEEKPNMSFRFGGAADLMNPIVVAMLMKSGQAPSPEDLQAALALMQSAGIPVNVIPQSPADSGLEIPPTEDEIEAEKLAAQEEGEGGSGGGPSIAEPMKDANPQWTPPSRVTKRTDEFGG